VSDAAAKIVSAALIAASAAGVDLALCDIRGDRVDPDPSTRDTWSRLSDEHDLLLSLVLCPPRQEWSEHLRELVGAGRAFAVRRPDAEGELWAATERRADIETVVPGARFAPDHALPAALALPSEQRAADEVEVALIQGHLDVSGPLTIDELCVRSGLPAGSVKMPSVSASNRMASTISASLTAAPVPPVAFTL